MKLTKPFTSKDFISDSIKIVDAYFGTANKKDLLNRTQYWKNYFTEHSVKTIGLHFYQCLNCTAIILACLENGITIITGSYSTDDVDEIANTADLVIAGFGKDELRNHPKVLWCNQLSDDPEYVPTLINPDFILFQNRTDSKRLVSNDAEFTAREFMAAVYLGSFSWYTSSMATIQYTNRVETNALFLIAPLLNGTTIYSCSHMIELASIMRQRWVGSIGISTVHLQALKVIEQSINFDSPFGTASFKFEFKNADVITQRNGPQQAAPSAELCDWLFNRGVNSITSVYIPNRSLLPCFTKTITKGSNEYFSNELGSPTHNLKYKIENEQLHIEDHSGQWVNTEDYAVEYDNKVFFKGDQRVNGQFIADVQRFMLGIVNDTEVTLGDFVIRFEEDVLTVYSFRSATHDAISLCKTLPMELLNFAGIQKINYIHWDKSKVYNV